MAANIRYRVPYEMVMAADDLSSGKPVRNIFYLRNASHTAPAPGYGTFLPGSDLATLVTNVYNQWNALIMNNLNANYKAASLTAQAIIGKRYATPFLPMANVIAGTPVQVETSFPHGLLTGDVVSIAGVTGPTGVNGLWIITVITATRFSLDGSTAAGAWTFDGSLQLASGQLQWLYTDKHVKIVSDTGLSVGDMLPLFVTGSVRRLNGGVGRNFRSGLRVSPYSELHQNEGKWDPVVKAAIQTNFTTFLTQAYLNGATDPNAAESYHWVISKAIAFTKASPFTEADSFTASVTGAEFRPNTGSLVRRKPKLGAPIA